MNVKFQKTKMPNVKKALTISTTKEKLTTLPKLGQCFFQP